MVAESSCVSVTFSIRKLVQGALSTIDQSINEEVKQYWLQHQPWDTPLMSGLQLDFMLQVTTP